MSNAVRAAHGLRSLLLLGALSIGCGQPAAPGPGPELATSAPTAAPPTLIQGAGRPPAHGDAATPAALAGSPSSKAAPRANMQLQVEVPGTPADWGELRTLAVLVEAAKTRDKVPASPGKRRIPPAARRPGAQAGPAQEPGFRLSYAPTDDPAQAAFRKAFQQERVFESAVAQLNKQIDIGGSVLIEFAVCGESNAYYDDGNRDEDEDEDEDEDTDDDTDEDTDDDTDEQHETSAGTPDSNGGKASSDEEPGEDGDEHDRPRIIMCYELIPDYLELFARDTEDPKEIGEQVVSAMYFTFFHEVGHALVDNLALPVVGREEDAVDQLATLLLLQMGDQGVGAAFAAANAFAAEQLAANEDDDGPELWDEHSMSGQRMYDMLCMIYGSNPEAFAELVGDDGVPETRADQCPGSYEQTVRAWQALLQPHLPPGATLGVTLPSPESVSAAATVPAAKPAE
jgi:hypothetical protein